MLLRLAQRVAPGIIWAGDPTSGKVALTFDDGPDGRWTPQVLAALRRGQVGATFFLAGEQARRYPDVVVAIRADGHEIGNHSDSWTHSRHLTDGEFEDSLLRAEVTLGLADARVKYFRPAGGWIRPGQLRILQRHRYRCVLASAVPLDPYSPPAACIAWLVKQSLRAGAIIVLHDGGGDRSRSVAAVPLVLAACRARGLDPVRLSELLSVATRAEEKDWEDSGSQRKQSLPG